MFKIILYFLVLLALLIVGLGISLTHAQIAGAWLLLLVFWVGLGLVAVVFRVRKLAGVTRLARKMRVDRQALRDATARAEREQHTPDFPTHRVAGRE